MAGVLVALYVVVICLVIVGLMFAIKKIFSDNKGDKK